MHKPHPRGVWRRRGMAISPWVGSLLQFSLHTSMYKPNRWISKADSVKIR
jgi:hypothetical protein